jgi:hypothetical protein
MLSICKEIVVFLLVAKLLENFGTLEKYGKFVRLIVSFIVVLKLITPIFSILGADLNLQQISSEIEKRFLIDIEDTVPDIETREVDKIEIPVSEIVVEEIRWEK